jgi:catechol 2,3-dioxygenase-like lactoylglutathione lyase family enzyme
VDRLYVTVGSLRSPLDREPTQHVSYEEHVSWFAVADHLPRHRGKTDVLCTTTGVHVILYVADQSRSRAFYEAVLGVPPRLDVPGMTEFELPGGAVLGLMPEHGIQTLLGPSFAVGGADVSRAEVYLRVPEARAMHTRALAAGAVELSPRTDRSWGEPVSYLRDADGHVLALAG